jgi:type I restriction enzyme M protein
MTDSSSSITWFGSSGVVIEEDGKTEEEFIEAIVNLSDKLSTLNSESSELEKIINRNLRTLTNQ